MKEQFYRMLNVIVERYLIKEEKQVIFSNFFIILLLIEQALLNLSYIYGTSQFSYITLISVITRPQQVLPIYTEFQYVIFFISICYIINIVSTIPYEKQFGVFGQLLRTGLMNFIFEYSRGTIQMATHSLLILITLLEAIILQGTLNAQTKNFQHTRFSLLDFILLFLNYVIMILYSYQYSGKSVMVLAFIMNIGNTINQLVYSPLKNLTIKSILLTIYTVTIYLGVMHLSDIENNYTSELIMIPCIFQIWYQYLIQDFRLINNKKSIKMLDALNYLNNIIDLKQINIEKPKSIPDRIIYASLLILQNQDYGAFMELTSMKNSELSYLLIFKKNVIMKKCMHKIENQIQAASNTTPKLASAVTSLMTSEQQNYSVQIDIVNILKEKIRCQQLLLQNQSQSIYKHYIKFTEKLINLKKKLEKQYEDFPCDKTQGILGFFYVEVINDYLIANQLFSIAAMSDEKLKRIVTNQDVFSNKMIYIMSTYNGSLTIKKVSNDAPTFLMKEDEQLIGKPTTLLVPPGIAEHHDKLVYQFLHNGQAKFFRKFTSNYLFNSKKNSMISIDFTFEIDLKHDFSFVTIIQPTIKQKLSLVVNQDHKVSCFSEALIEQLGIQLFFENYIGMSAQLMLPDFPLAICGHEQIENAEIHFPSFEDIVYQSMSTQTQTIYVTSYSVDQNIIDGKALFFILTFDFFKKPNDQNQKSIQNFNSDHNQIFDSNIEFFALVNEDSKVRIPYHETSQKRVTSSYYQTPPQNEKQFDKIQSELTMLGQQEYLLSPQQEDLFLLKKQLYFTKPNNFQIKVQTPVAAQSENHDNDSQDRMVMYQDDRSSQISSLQGVRKSKYYKKYELLSKMYELKSYSASHKLFISMLIACIVFELATQTIQLTEINKNLTSLAGDIDLLQIKNYAFQPLETFLVTRYTLLNYRIQSDNKTINASTYAKLIQFPRSNLNLGYDQLDSNLKTVFNRPALQDFLETTYLTVFSYVGTKLLGEQFNISLRNSMNILLSYEYTIKMAYMIDGAVQADSPPIYYSYKNYLPMKHLFSDLNELVLSETQVRSKNIASQSQAIFVVCVVTLICFLILILNYFFQINKSINKHFQLMHNIPLEYVEDDSMRLKVLSDKILKDSNSLFKYQFHLDFKEKQLENNRTKSASIRRLNNKLRLISCQDLYYYLFLIGMILLIAGNAFLTYYETDIYLGKYPATANFYKSLSDVGTDIPTMYAQRELLYGRGNLWFYNSTDFQDILLEIKNSLDRTYSFANQDLDFNKFLVSNNFQSFYESVSTSNLCPYIPDNLVKKSKSLCDIVMNGNMERGLKTMLIYISNYIQTDMAINQFTSRNQTVYLVLEGAFLVSNIIKVVNDRFNIDLANQTQLYTDQINIQNILLLSTLFLLIIIVVTFVQKRLTHKMHLVQRLIFLLPIKTLFSDDAFERNLRQLLLSY